jgi:hypothetical protein
MRLALLLLFLSGCSRWSGLAAARREVVSDALLAQRFPLHPEVAVGRMRGRLGAAHCDRLVTGELSCGGCIRGRCFQLLEEDGTTRVATKAELTEAELTAIWQPLDAPSLTALRSTIDDRVQDKLIEQEQRFEPRWGATVGVLAGVAVETSPLGSVMLGGRLGVRRWFNAHLIGHSAVEYRFRGEHELSFRVGLEVARWTDGRLWGAVGAPGVSVSMFIGPLFRFTVLRGGLRTGVGIHLTDIRSAPLFVEIAADTHFARDPRVTATLTIGIGL